MESHTGGKFVRLWERCSRFRGNPGGATPTHQRNQDEKHAKEAHADGDGGKAHRLRAFVEGLHDYWLSGFQRVVFSLPRCLSVMRRHPPPAKGKKVDAKPRPLDLSELAKSTQELGRSNPIPLSIKLHVLRRRLEELPCGVCKEWALWSWSKWSKRDGDVAGKPYVADLAAFAQEQPPAPGGAWILSLKLVIF